MSLIERILESFFQPLNFTPRTLAMICISMSLFGNVLTAQHNGSAEELADHERAFAAASDSKGIKRSFLLFLADSCIMFNPRPVNGKKLYESREESPASLHWSPAFVEVSASGDFGISTGPWEYQRSKKDTIVAAGHYFSVWQKQPNGTWKVVFDHGIEYPKQMRLNEQQRLNQLTTGVVNLQGETAHASALWDAENRFKAAAINQGINEAYDRFMSSNGRVYRNGHLPAVMKTTSLQLISKFPHYISATQSGFRISSSGDLGITYGLCVTADKDSASYMRVWRKETDWKIAVDMLEPFTK